MGWQITLHFSPVLAFAGKGQHRGPKCLSSLSARHAVSQISFPPRKASSYAPQIAKRGRKEHQIHPRPPHPSTSIRYINNCRPHRPSDCSLCIPCLCIEHLSVLIQVYIYPICRGSPHPQPPHHSSTSPLHSTLKHTSTSHTYNQTYPSANFIRHVVSRRRLCEERNST